MYLYRSKITVIKQIIAFFHFLYATRHSQITTENVPVVRAYRSKKLPSQLRLGVFSYFGLLLIGDNTRFFI